MPRVLPSYRRTASCLMLIVLACLLGACSTVPPHNRLATWIPSPNYNARAPQLIVIHFTSEGSAAEALHTLRTHNGGGRVSAHYMIGADGHIYQLVADRMRAWQAGVGRWGTITDLNSASIGIELDNNGHEPFPPVQIDSLLRLLDDLTTRWHIPRTQIIGHEDLAPTRRDDPGPYFPWAQLAAAGFGRWPKGPLTDPPAGFDPWLAMAALGYDLSDRGAAVRAFHHHFRAMQGDTLDAQDARVLYALVRPLEGGMPAVEGRTRANPVER